MALNESKASSAEVEKTLDLYSLWHNWLIVESSGDKLTTVLNGVNQN